MKWILGILLVVGAIWAFFDVNVFWRNRKRVDISHAIKSLLVLLEDGGHLSLEARGSPIVLRVIRSQERGSGATLTLVVPMASWSERAEPELRRFCEVHEYDSHFRPRERSDVLCEINLQVEDIWGSSAGAAGARLVNLVLDAHSVARDSRLKLDLVGRRSRRLVERERFLRAEGGTG